MAGHAVARCARSSLRLAASRRGLGRARNSRAAGPGSRTEALHGFPAPTVIDACLMVGTRSSSNRLGLGGSSSARVPAAARPRRAWLCSGSCACSARASSAWPWVRVGASDDASPAGARPAPSSGAARGSLAELAIDAGGRRPEPGSARPAGWRALRQRPAPPRPGIGSPLGRRLTHSLRDQGERSNGERDHAERAENHPTPREPSGRRDLEPPGSAPPGSAPWHSPSSSAPPASRPSSAAPSVARGCRLAQHLGVGVRRRRGETRPRANARERATLVEQEPAQLERDLVRAAAGARLLGQQAHARGGRAMGMPRSGAAWRGSSARV